MHPTTAVRQVSAQIGAVAKGRQTEATGHYFFRGIDDALEVLHPALIEVGLTIIPRVVNREETRTITEKQRLVTLDVEYDLWTDDVEVPVVAGPFVGEGADSSDKAANKALSNAYKMMVWETFCVPISGASVDSETEPGREAEPPSQVSSFEDEPALSAVGDHKAEWPAEDLEALEERIDALPASAVERLFDHLSKGLEPDEVREVYHLPPSWGDQIAKVVTKAEEAVAEGGYS